VERRAGEDPRVVRRQLRPEIEALLLVRPAGRELVADAKITPPGPAAQGHADSQFALQVLREEPAAEVAQPVLQRLVDAVPDDVEEAALPACLAEALGDGPPGGGPRDQAAHVDDRDVREVTYRSHQPLPPIRGHHATPIRARRPQRQSDFGPGRMLAVCHSVPQ
jgi:hypothetical protein